MTQDGPYESYKWNNAYLVHGGEWDQNHLEAICESLVSTSLTQTKVSFFFSFVRLIVSVDSDTSVLILDVL